MKGCSNHSVCPRTDPIRPIQPSRNQLVVKRLGLGDFNENKQLQRQQSAVSCTFQEEPDVERGTGSKGHTAGGSLASIGRTNARSKRNEWPLDGPARSASVHSDYSTVGLWA
ncbi:hypothetical protein V2G26_021271 [Clonostachys chloroleuca]